MAAASTSHAASSTSSNSVTSRIPKASTEVAITDEKEAAAVLRLVNMLDDLDDVSRVSANFDIDDELMAKLDS